MVVIMKRGSQPHEIQNVIAFIEENGFRPHLSQGESNAIIGLIGEIGDQRSALRSHLSVFAGVENVITITKPFKLASRDIKYDDTTIALGTHTICADTYTVIAGPCSVESRDQILETAHFVKDQGAHILRGGAFKPRTSPYSFQGLGVEALEYLSEAGRQTGLPVVTEVLSPQDVEVVARYADIVQIGARNMQNFALLNEVSTIDKPVLLKRGPMATIEEFLLAAEYILKGGNYNVILCERGIRTFETATRYTLDISAVPLIRQLSHLPIIIDPSHATGNRSLVPSLACAGLAVGAHGVMVEVHKEPERAKSDGPQSLDFPMFTSMMQKLKQMHSQHKGLKQ
ncbi:MAG: 3-deoxy-7-phosphoheptulonate synthase [bacterium]